MKRPLSLSGPLHSKKALVFKPFSVFQTVFPNFFESVFFASFFPILKKFRFCKHYHQKLTYWHRLYKNHTIEAEHQLFTLRNSTLNTTTMPLHKKKYIHIIHQHKQQESNKTRPYNNADKKKAMKHNNNNKKTTVQTKRRKTQTKSLNRQTKQAKDRFQTILHR